MNNPVDAPIVAILARLRTRKRFLNMVRGSMHGLLYGTCAAMAFAGAGWLARAEWIFTAPWLAAMAIPIAILLGIAVGALLPIDDLRLARALDRASSSDDRFASAVQLARHARQSRARLIAEDALSRVTNTSARSALPWRVPRSVKWLPLPLVALAALLWFAPDQSVVVAAPAAPEISDDDWAAIHNEFQKDLQELPEPRTDEERQLRKDLENLAKLIEQKPEKKEALMELARLNERVQKQRQSLGMRDVSMKAAARSLARSQSLKPFSSALKEGDYEKAAAEMDRLAEQLKNDANSPDAAEFESIASDMERMANEMASEEQLQQACQNCANAASSMNRESLSKACKNLSNQLRKNSERMRQCDNCGSCSSMLDKLKRMMNSRSQCQGCQGGCSQCQGGSSMNRNARKGGFKAGWGTAAKWDGGTLAKHDEQRLPDMVDAQERAGENTSYKVVSPDERAQSAQRYEEMFAEFVQKSEADLDLDTVPVAYREFLRKYFNSIRPQDEAPSSSDAPTENEQP